MFFYHIYKTFRHSIFSVRVEKVFVLFLCWIWIECLKQVYIRFALSFSLFKCLNQLLSSKVNWLISKQINLLRLFLDIKLLWNHQLFLKHLYFIYAFHPFLCLLSFDLRWSELACLWAFTITTFVGVLFTYNSFQTEVLFLEVEGRQLSKLVIIVGHWVESNWDADRIVNLIF